MQKEISLIPTTRCLETKDAIIHPTVVIYDVLRATSTITTALAQGAKAVIPVLEPKDALRLHAYLGKQTSALLLGGERNGEPITGFHLGNSPMEYTREKVYGQTIIFTSTNGTRAMISSQKAGADCILIASLLNQSSIVNFLKQAPAITVVCAGVRGRFAFEDFYAAGLMLKELLDSGHGCLLDDCALAALGLAQGFLGNPEVIALGYHGCRLKGKEKTADVQFCSTANQFSIVPIFQKECITLGS